MKYLDQLLFIISFLGKLLEQVYCPNDEKCYALYEEGVTFENARTFCTNAGGNMFVPDSLSHTKEVSDKMSASIWIGTMNPTEDNTYWMNINTGFELSFTNWADNEPNGKTTEKCVTMTTDGIWYDIPCDNKRQTICQFDFSSSSCKYFFTE